MVTVIIKYDKDESSKWSATTINFVSLERVLSFNINTKHSYLSVPYGP